MNRWIRNLAVLLLIQVGVLAILQFGFGADAADEAETFVGLTANAIERLKITDNEANEIELNKDADGWRMASGLPVDQAKVVGLLEKLAALRAGWPVSRSGGNTLSRFEVSEDNFQRRVTLGGDAIDEVDVYFGTSPGYQQVHARSVSNEVYAVKLSNFEMPAESEDWLDKDLLQPRGEILKVSFVAATESAEAVEVSSADSGWLVNGSEANAEAITALLDRLKSLRVLGIAEAGAGVPTLVRVTDAEGDYELQLWQGESKSDYMVSSSRYPVAVFRMPTYLAEQLEPNIEELLAVSVTE